jgi:energy-coupling factor transporter transmembrane protein EcfT
MDGERFVKAGVTGIVLLISFVVLMLAARFLWVLALVLSPFLLVAAFIYLVGYAAPNLGVIGRQVHRAAEFRARSFLDWLDFKAPSWVWPAIRATRTFLDWLGLQVKAL